MKGKQQKEALYSKNIIDIEERDGCVVPNSYTEDLTSSVMVLKGPLFGEWLGQEGGALRPRSSAFMKEAEEKSSEKMLSGTQEYLARF